MKKILMRVSSLAFLFACVFALQSTNVHATDYTVTCTDGDITAELQEVLDKNRSSEGADAVNVTIKPGEYTISENLRIHSNTTINMEGVTITRGSALNDDTTMLRLRREKDWNDAGGYSEYSGGSNITINGGTWDGNAKSGCLIRFGHASGITLNGCTFTNVKDGHEVELGGCKDVTITGCTFTGFTGSWGATTNYEALQLEICNANHFSSYAPYDNTVCKDVTITNCTFTDLQRGVGTHAAVDGKYSTGITISGNTFENILGYAITAINYKDCTIDNNDITNCASGILFRTMDQSHANFYNTGTKCKAVLGTNSSITNNRITIEKVTRGGKTYGNIAYGIQLYGEKLSSAVSKNNNKIVAGDYRVSGVNVSGNTINLNVTGYAIWLQGATKNTIENNTINSNAKKKNKGGNGDGVRLQKSSKNTISNNTITNLKTNGTAKNMIGICIMQKSKDNTVSGNTITKASKYGINVVEGSDGTKLTKNTITKAKKYGINVRKSKKVKIISNTITKAKSYGIMVAEKAVATAKKNKITGCKEKTHTWAGGVIKK